MPSGYHIDPKDAVPIWRQIELSTRRLVASGALTPGASLPSVRDMARDLGVNPMTVSKAYQRLAEAGIVEVRRGEGTFVHAATEPGSREERLREVREEAERLASAALALGVSAQQAVREVRDAFDRLGRSGADREDES